MTLNELCELGEHHLKKQLYVPLPTVALAAIGEEKPTAVEGKKDSPIASEDVEKIVKRILGSQRRWKKRVPRPESVCYRCQEKGHFARECTSPAPVPESPVPEPGQENQQGKL